MHLSAQPSRLTIGNKMRKCLVCLNDYKVGGYKYCSKTCAKIANANMASNRELTAALVIADKFICQFCNELVINNLANRKTKFCSDYCRRQHRYLNVEIPRKINQYRNSGKVAFGDIINCKNPECDKTFAKKYTKKFCTKSCHAKFTSKLKSLNGFIPRSNVKFVNCKDCKNLFCRKSRGTRAFCKNCSALRKRAVDARKSHKRRTGQILTMSVNDLAKRDGSRCNVCRKKIDLSLSGNAKWGPTIDHLIPVSLGGTNNSENLALAHRHCNVARSNREPAQLLLSA